MIYLLNNNQLETSIVLKIGIFAEGFFAQKPHKYYPTFLYAVSLQSCSK